MADPLTVHVKVDDRKFVVRFDQHGDPTSIKQIKVSSPGRPWEALYAAPYWHHSAPLGGPNTMPSRVVAAAREKLRAEAAEALRIAK